MKLGISRFKVSRRHGKADRTEFHIAYTSHTRIRDGSHTDDFKADFECDCKEIEEDSGRNGGVSR